VGGPEAEPQPARLRCSIHPSASQSATLAARTNQTGHDEASAIIVSGSLPISTRMSSTPTTRVQAWEGLAQFSIWLCSASHSRAAFSANSAGRRRAHHEVRRRATRRSLRQ